jgi:hypothetical protein
MTPCLPKLACSLFQNLQQFEAVAGGAREGSISGQTTRGVALQLYKLRRGAVKDSVISEATDNARAAGPSGPFYSARWFSPLMTPIAQ